MPYLQTNTRQFGKTICPYPSNDPKPSTPSPSCHTTPQTRHTPPLPPANVPHPQPPSQMCNTPSPTTQTYFTPLAPWWTTWWTTPLSHHSTCLVTCCHPRPPAWRDPHQVVSPKLSPFAFDARHLPPSTVCHRQVISQHSQLADIQRFQFPSLIT